MKDVYLPSDVSVASTAFLGCPETCTFHCETQEVANQILKGLPDAHIEYDYAEYMSRKRIISNNSIATFKGYMKSKNSNEISLEFLLWNFIFRYFLTYTNNR